MSKELEAARELAKMLEEKESANKVLLSEVVPGEVVMIGEYPFIVLEQQEGQTCLISKGFMEENVQFGENRNYKESNLRVIIEDDIEPEIEAAVGAENLVENEVSLISVDMQDEFGTLKCKVRPLTFDEARKYNNLIADKNLNDWWWTCTPWSTSERGWNSSVAVVCPSGVIRNDYYDYDLGVRPFCILKSNIFVSRGE